MGALCSFDAFLAKYRLDDPALQQLAAIVRGADSLRLEPMVQALPDRNTQLSSQDPVTQRSSSAHDPTGSPSLCRARWHCLTIVCRTDRPSPLGPVCHFVPVPSRSLKKWGAPPVRNRASVRNGGALVRVANAYKQCLQHSSTGPPPSGALGRRAGLRLAESVKSTLVPNAVIWTPHSHPFPTSAIF